MAVDPSSLAPLSYDPESSAAVLVGSSRFPRDRDNLPPLPGVTANVIDFERHLRDGGVVGFPAQRVHRLLDEEDIAVVAERVALVCRETQGLVLLYYAGHGLISRDGDLLLTLQNSTFGLSEANCLQWKTIKGYLLDSPAAMKVVILDCCFSGRAFELMGPNEEVLRQDLDVKGTIVLASSPRNEPSLSQPGERRTAFTDALLTTIEQGVDNASLGITVSELFTAAKQRLRALGAPEPQSLASYDSSDVVLVRNRRSDLSREASSFDSLMNQVEARIGNFLDMRLGKEGLQAAMEEPDERENVILAVLRYSLFSFFLAAEVGWLLYLSAPSVEGRYSSSPQLAYPRIVGFGTTTAILLVISLALVRLALGALREPGASGLMRAFGLGRRAIRRIARYASVNVGVVTVAALIGPFLTLWDT